MMKHHYVLAQSKLYQKLKNKQIQLEATFNTYYKVVMKGFVDRKRLPFPMVSYSSCEFRHLSLS